jgi:hypothetical protein
LVGGSSLLAGELVDPLIGGHLEPLRGVEQKGGVGQGQVIGPLVFTAPMGGR